jgi:hypothetical protein
MSPPLLVAYVSPDVARALLKLAGDQKNSLRGAAKAVAVPLLGFAAGTMGGFGAGRAMDSIHEALAGGPIPGRTLRRAAPLLGGAAGLAYGMYRARAMEDLKRALESHHDEAGRRDP